MATEYQSGTSKPNLKEIIEIVRSPAVVLRESEFLFNTNEILNCRRHQSEGDLVKKNVPAAVERRVKNAELESTKIEKNLPLQSQKLINNIKIGDVNEIESEVKKKALLDFEAESDYRPRYSFVNHLKNKDGDKFRGNDYLSVVKFSEYLANTKTTEAKESDPMERFKKLVADYQEKDPCKNFDAEESDPIERFKKLMADYKEKYDFKNVDAKESDPMERFKKLVTVFQEKDAFKNVDAKESDTMEKFNRLSVGNREKDAFRSIDAEQSDPLERLKKLIVDYEEEDKMHKGVSRSLLDLRNNCDSTHQKSSYRAKRRSKSTVNCLLNSKQLQEEKKPAKLQKRLKQSKDLKAIRTMKNFDAGYPQTQTILLDKDETESNSSAYPLLNPPFDNEKNQINEEEVNTVGKFITVHSAMAGNLSQIFHSNIGIDEILIDA